MSPRKLAVRPRIASASVRTYSRRIASAAAIHATQSANAAHPTARVPPTPISTAISPAATTLPAPFSTATSMYALAFSLISSGTGTYKISRPVRSAEYRRLVSAAFAETTAASVPQIATPKVVTSISAGSSSTAVDTPQRLMAGRSAITTTIGIHCVAALNRPWNAATASRVWKTSSETTLNW